MKTWFWLFLCILNLMAGCASGSYEKGPASHGEISDYWQNILYPQTSEQEKEGEGGEIPPRLYLTPDLPGGRVLIPLPLPSLGPGMRVR